MRTVAAWSAVLCVLLSGCKSSSGGTGLTGTVTVTPTSATATAGGAPITFTATSDTTNIAWSISPQVGTLSKFIGPTTDYTPPAALDAAQTVTVTATIVNTDRSASAQVTVQPILVDAGAPGTLQVTVTNPDSAFTPQIVVASEGQRWTLSGDDVLSLLPGTYSVYGRADVTPDPVVGTASVATASPTPVSVASNTTSSVQVVYAGPHPATGKLWIPDCGGGTNSGSVVAIQASVLDGPTDGGRATLSHRIWTDGGCAEALAFDPQGNLWVADFADGVQGKIWGFHFLPDGGADAPIVISALPDGGGPSSAQALAFSPSGDLWVANVSDLSGNGALLRYTPDALAASGSPQPASVIDSMPVDGGYDSISAPSDIAFAPNGDLWITNARQGTVVRFANTDAGISPSPAAVVYDDGTHWIDPNGLSFDAHGHLWLAGRQSSTVVELDPAAYSGTAPAQPLATVTTPDGGQTFPLLGVSNLTFDQSGNLWVVNAGGATLVKFDAPDTFSGVVAPTPEKSWTGAPLVDNGRLQFDPPASGMTLFP